jgi:hypothetical protein
MYLLQREREEEEDSEGSLADFIDDDSTPDVSYILFRFDWTLPNRPDLYLG